MTELSRGPSGVRHRTGKEYVSQPVNWQRLIGGRGGVKVDLPAGTYSDDTQLRLCVSRSIRGNGSFDVETFAKIEVTVWQGYCLGAGIGSKAAASNLSKRGVNWFSNFFVTDRQKYTTAGGNGAAMRIQPHVWSAISSRDEMIRQVFRDSIVTHGHPHGFGGALFHALCLWDTLVNREIPSFELARGYIAFLDRLPALIENDGELSQFWLPSWEKAAKSSFADALRQFQDEAVEDLQAVEDVLRHGSKEAYAALLERLGCLSDRFRGSGFKTALAAFALSRIYVPESIEDALAASANQLDSDTDTIATMAGALLGALSERTPDWIVQDKTYLESEARRLSGIGLGADKESFSYPDVSGWEPPSNQSDAVVRYNGGLGLIGLGALRSLSAEYKSRNAIWQWFELPFGQTVLTKRRSEISNVVNADQMPGIQKVVRKEAKNETANLRQNSFSFATDAANRASQELASHSKNKQMTKEFPGIDKATDIVISSKFDDATIGRLINQCIEATGSIELVASLSAIIAKARLARMRRK
jgi:ADP-ribosylglycohydrolase